MPSTAPRPSNLKSWAHSDRSASITLTRAAPAAGTKEFMTNSRGASNSREITKSYPVACAAAPLLALLSAMRLLLFGLFFLKPVQILVQTIKALLEESPIVLRPLRHVFQRPRLEPARSPLCFAPARDQPRPLEHLQMLQDRRYAHLKRLSQLSHRGFAGDQARQYRPPCRVGECREGSAEVIGRQLVFNLWVKYNEKGIRVKHFVK